VDGEDDEDDEDDNKENNEKVVVDILDEKDKLKSSFMKKVERKIGKKGKSVKKNLLLRSPPSKLNVANKDMNNNTQTSDDINEVSKKSSQKRRKKAAYKGGQGLSIFIGFYQLFICSFGCQKWIL
jgi:hypothetical protein